MNRFFQAYFAAYGISCLFVMLKKYCFFYYFAL